MWDPSGVALSFHLLSGSSQTSYLIEDREQLSQCCYSGKQMGAWYTSVQIVAMAILSSGFHWCKYERCQADRTDAAFWHESVTSVTLSRSYLDDGIVLLGPRCHTELISVISFIVLMSSMYSFSRYFFSFFLTASPLHTPPFALSCPLTTDEAIKDALQKNAANSTAAGDANTPKRQRGNSSLIPDGLIEVAVRIFCSNNTWTVQNVWMPLQAK